MTNMNIEQGKVAQNIPKYIFTSAVLPHDPPTGKLSKVSSSVNDAHIGIEFKNFMEFDICTYIDKFT